jgi:small subunit ribosomal protein S4
MSNPNSDKKLLKNFRGTSICPKSQPKKSIRATKRKMKVSVYGSQQNMKQILQRYYGITGRKLHKAYTEASRRNGPTGVIMVHLLESRLDNVVYRMGFASTRAEARQMVSHGHILVNDKKVDIRSYLVNIGDKVSITKKAAQHTRVQSAIELHKTEENPCDWIGYDHDNFVGELKALPDLDSLPEEFSKINLVVEWYSK